MHWFRKQKGKWVVRYGKIIDNGISAIVSNLPEDCNFSFLGFPIEMVDVLVLCMAKHEAAGLSTA